MPPDAAAAATATAMEVNQEVAEADAAAGVAMQRKRLETAVDLCSIAIGAAEVRLESIREQQRMEEEGKLRKGGATAVAARGRLNARAV